MTNRLFSRNILLGFLSWLIPFLRHKLFRSHRTGDIINPNFLKLFYPCRWYYDILRAMDYFRNAEVKYDKRMDDAIKLILEKRTPEGNGNWPQNTLVKYILKWKNLAARAVGIP